MIYDDLFRQVRVWARLGHSAVAIQAELDARYEQIAAVLEERAKGARAAAPGPSREERAAAAHRTMSQSAHDAVSHDA